MRIALIGPCPPLRGGIVAHTAGMARALRAIGHEVFVIGYRRIYPGPPHGRLPRSLSRESDGDAATLIDALDPRSWIEARAWLLDREPDALVLQWWNPIVGPALRTLLGGVRRPVVAVCHNASPHERFPAWRFLRWLLFSKVDSFLVHSRAVSQSLARDGYFQQSVATAMPLLLRAGRDPLPRQLARHRIGVPSGPPLAVFVGHLRAYKGIDLLLRAWERARLPLGSHLVVAGQIPRWPLGIGRFAGMRGRCFNSVTIIHRYVEDREFCELLGSADVLVLPHRRASQSGTLPMGLALGLRVVASDAGGLSESLPGDSGHAVFRAGDVDALARALERSMWGAWVEILRGHRRLGVETAMSNSAFEESWAPVARCLESLCGSGPASGSGGRERDDGAEWPIRESGIDSLRTQAYWPMTARDRMRPRMRLRGFGRART